MHLNLKKLALHSVVLGAFYFPFCAFATLPPPLPPCKFSGRASFSLASLKAAVIEEVALDEAWRCSGPVLQKRGVEAMPIWISLLDHPDQRIQKFALDGIENIVIDRYTQREKDTKFSSSVIRSLTGYELKKILLAGVKHNTPASHLCFFLPNLAQDGVGRDSIPELIAMLKAKDQLAINTAYCLGNLGKVARPAIPKLLALLADKDAEIKSSEADNFDQQAWEAIAQIGVDTPAQFHTLLDKFNIGNGSYHNSYKRSALLRFDPLPPALAVRFINELNQIDLKSNSRFEIDPVFPWLQLLSFTHSEKAASALLPFKIYSVMANIGPVAVPFLIKELSKTKPVQESDAIAKALLQIATPEAKLAAMTYIEKQVPALLASLKGPYGDHRRFTELKQDAAIAFKPLTMLLSDSDVEVRWRAYAALEKIGAENVNDDEKRRAKGDFGKPQDYRLRDPNFPWNESFEKLRELGLRGSYDALSALSTRGASSIPVLMDLIENKAISKYAGSDAIPRDRAIDTLIDMGEQATSAWPRLIADLDDERLGHNLGSDTSPKLAYLGGRSNYVIELLFKHMMKSKDSGGRWYVASVLGALLSRPPAMLLPSPMLELLQEKLKDKKTWDAMWNDGSGLPGNLVIALNRGIQNKDKKFLYKRDTEEKLNKLHANKASAHSCLQMKSDDGRISPFPDASCFVREIDDFWHYFPGERPTAIDTLTTLLTDKHPKNRQMASDLLGSLGAYSTSALPAMSRLLKDDSALLRQVAADNLVRLARRGVVAPGLIPHLLRLIDGNDESQAYLAATALSSLPAIPARYAETLAHAIKRNKFPQNFEYLVIALGNTQSLIGAKSLLHHLKPGLSLNQMNRIGRALQKSGLIAEKLTIDAIAHSDSRDISIVLVKTLTQSGLEKNKRIAGLEYEKILAVLMHDVSVPDTLETWNAETRQKAAQDLALLVENFPQARKQLLPLMRNPDPLIREIALRALSDIPNEEISAAFQLASKDMNHKLAKLAEFYLEEKRKIPEGIYTRWSRCVELSKYDLAIAQQCEMM
ncbi:HEAT repeat domain-containing protein [Undibacterium sp. JH2W]|uniref:HEAT repeat domain-containing protein n=1 Tax=Undibacterium sp. JH2W TaxID=3413037 RepID=UPI003BF1DE9D